ncbi:MAG: AAA family ATPase [Pseudomonadota bacterium]
MIILQALEAGKHVVIDDTNLHPKHIKNVTELVKGQAKVEVNNSFLQVPVKECIRRDLQRQNSVGKDVIMQMYRQFLLPKLEPPVHNPALADVIVVDMDGTLALMGDPLIAGHRHRSPYDVSKCDQDPPNMPVIQTILKWQETHKIIVMSGRTDDGKEKTVSWLEKYGVKYSELHMRKLGDMRKDTIVKEEMYRAHLEGRYNVIAVFDDRKSVVEMWRSLGLTVFQVAEGDF